MAIEHLFVQEEARRQGVGRALIARATTFAEQGGASQISTSVPAAGRDGQRFFARLGFTPFVVRRVASVSARAPSAGPGAVPGPRRDRAASPLAAGPQHGWRAARPQQRLTGTADGAARPPVPVGGRL